jgi:hypothetical protein
VLQREALVLGHSGGRTFHPIHRLDGPTIAAFQPQAATCNFIPNTLSGDEGSPSARAQCVRIFRHNPLAGKIFPKADRNMDEIAGEILPG